MTVPTRLVTVSQTLAYVGEPDDLDGIIAQTIERVTAEIQKVTVQTFSVETYTEDVDGGSAELMLARRPIASVTSVTDRADATVFEATEIEAASEAGYLLITDTFMPIGTLWGAGERRWRVVYTAGLAAVPRDIEQACLEWVASILLRRDGSLKSETVGDFIAQHLDAALPPRVRETIARYTEPVF